VLSDVTALSGADYCDYIWGEVDTKDLSTCKPGLWFT
jgi:hypothetical protein